MPKKEIKNDLEEDLKYLLGTLGIEIFYSIERGARNDETIKLFSGIPIVCIKGRIPVLVGLNLIEKKNKEYFLTKKGQRFKNLLEREER
jgi:predicted transcriptional regulator